MNPRKELLWSLWVCAIWVCGIWRFGTYGCHEGLGLRISGGGGVRLLLLSTLLRNL